MANYKLSDLIEKLRSTKNSQLEYANEKVWVLMERYDDVSTKSTYYILTDGKKRAVTLKVEALLEEIKNVFNIDLLEKNPSLENWKNSTRRMWEMERPPLAALYDKLIESRHILKCTIDHTVWFLELEGNMFDASYQRFAFRNQSEGATGLHIGDLYQEVQKKFNINLFEIPLKSWIAI